MLSYFKKLFGTDTSNNTSLPQELVHINQEMYKKSVELSERNKTLLLLRKIDEIILSSVTDQNEIARRVTSLLVTETDFLIAAIFSHNSQKGILERLAIYETSAVFESNVKNSSEQLFLSEIPLSSSDNIIVQAAIEKRPKSSNTLQNSLWAATEAVKAQIIQKESGIKSIFVYPLMVREQLIGSIVIALTDEEQDVSEYTKDLLERMVQVIGIAIDNATLYNELQDANEKLKALDKLKDEFVSLASHELRTPMTAIKSYLWMTLQGQGGPLNDKQKLYIQRAYSSVDRLVKLVNDMLNISRIESGRMTVAMQKVDMNKIVQEVLDEVKPRALELSVNVVFEPVPTLAQVIADTDKIKEVLFNLIGNSLKFTPPGGKVTISLTQNGEYIETKVSDTGSGISPENISKLFQKFGMLPESYAANKTASGTGLGLYISRSIIEMHKGKIWAASEGVGKGSEFIFSLKVFNEEEFKKLNFAQKPNEKENLGIVHTQV